MKVVSPSVFLCNGADFQEEKTRTKARKILHLEYQKGSKVNPNVKILLPNFVSDVFHLSDRVLDLLEIAAYVFCADRFASRGPKDAIEYEGWARNLDFTVKVRDYEFWKSAEVNKKLSEALCFMSGDRVYRFSFQPGHKTPQTNLFDSDKFQLDPKHPTCVMLFSGGLDSLAGVLDRLKNSQDVICLISHRSGQPETAKTQDKLAQALNKEFPGRIKHYRFYCSLTGVRAVEETQRTRAFLYTSMAYALSGAMSLSEFYIHENGVTALNFPKRQDMINARASRTAHPKTLFLLQDLFSKISGNTFKILAPFMWKTKSDVFDSVRVNGGKKLISSSVSCSKTFQNLGQATHCGGCSQCIDRRFAAYASGLHDADENGIYGFDFIKEQVSEANTKTILTDYVRQARDFSQWNADHFYKELLDELTNVLGFVGITDESEAVQKLYSLCNSHGKQVFNAIRAMRQVHDNPFQKLVEGCFLRMVSEREYLKEPIQRLIYDISTKVTTAIPRMFQNNRPKDETDLNDKIQGILDGEKYELEREYPAITFALAKVIPDHSVKGQNLWIEAKYVRDATTPSKITDGMAADLIKYPEGCHILFIVYDPNRRIVNDQKFSADFESKGRCSVCIVR